MQSNCWPQGKFKESAGKIALCALVLFGAQGVQAQPRAGQGYHLAGLDVRAGGPCTSRSSSGYVRERGSVSISPYFLYERVFVKNGGAGINKVKVYSDHAFSSAYRKEYCIRGVTTYKHFGKDQVARDVTYTQQCRGACQPPSIVYGRWERKSW